MSRGLRHLMTAVLVFLLLLLFYFSLYTEPLAAMLPPSRPRPSIFNKDYADKQTESHGSSKGADSDPKTLALIRQGFIMPPSSEPYNLQEPQNTNPSMGQAQAIDHILKGKRGGFFVECGGLDGELRSNSLFFERERDWQGLVIEADPANFELMQAKHRRAYISPACLATTPQPSKVVFAQNSNRGHIYDVEGYDDAPAKGLVDVQCFPLYSFLLALNVTTVDYFSLDVEGAEYKVLQTIPWDKVDIKTLSVEYFHDAEGKEAIRNLLESNGYTLYTEITDPNNLANDFIFEKQNLLR